MSDLDVRRDGPILNLRIDREPKRNALNGEVLRGMLAALRDPGDARAILVTTAGEKIGCEMVGVTIGVEPNVEWLRGVKTPPELGRGVKTDGGFRTSLPHVFAAGDVAEVNGRIEPLWYAAKRQGAAVA